MSNSILEALTKGLWETHKGFYRWKKAQERSSSRPSYQPFRIRQVTLSEVVLGVLPEAIKRASGNGALPFSVRQLYYQVRPLIQDHTDKELDYGYFTPPLVTEYQLRHGAIPGLVYDPRGHLIEPHTVGAACSQCGSNLIINTRTWSPIASHRQAVALGTREVAGYTPELTDSRPEVRALAQEATRVNQSLVGGKTVLLEKDVSETDRYGRLLRYVYVGEVFVDAELVRLGYAQAVSYPPAQS